jgi:hypothetical protein
MLVGGDIDIAKSFAQNIKHFWGRIVQCSGGCFCIKVSSLSIADKIGGNVMNIVNCTESIWGKISLGIISVGRKLGDYESK